MAVPSVIGDLSTTASSNSPAGSDSPIEADNFLRAHASFIAQLEANKATKASPTFTGTPAAPTAAVDTNTTQVATTAFVIGQGYAKLAGPTFTGVPAAPTAAADTNTTQVATTAYVIGQGYAKLASPTFTGTPAAPTAAANTNTTQIATTAYVIGQGYAKLAGLTAFTSSQHVISVTTTAEDNTYSPIQVFRTGGTTKTGSGIEFYSNASLVGSVGILGGGVTYNTTSDYRLKDIEGALQSSGAFIDALQPKVGTWKLDGSPFVGFVAHELQEVSPSSVTGQKDGENMQSVSYSSAELIANMVAELKSLRARVAALET